MKLLAFCFSIALSNSCFAMVVSFWDFNDGFAVADGSPQIIHNATSGSGILYQQRADTDGNGKDGTAFVDASNGINAAAGKAMAWDDLAKSGENDAEFFFSFSTSNIRDIAVSFDLRGNVGIIPSFDLKYSLTNLVDVVNPPDVVGTIKDFSGGISTDIFLDYPVNAIDSYARVTLDLSGIADLNNQSFVALRFDDWSEGTGNDDMRIDNLLVTGAPIPEPSSVLLIGIGLLAPLFRRRR